MSTIPIDPPEESFAYVIVGGGIAGCSCIKQLSQLLAGREKKESICLISASKELRGVANVTEMSRFLLDMDVVQLSEKQLLDEVKAMIGGNTLKVTVIIGKVDTVDTDERLVLLDDGKTIRFGKLCLCTGGVPNPIAYSPKVAVLRDFDSVSNLTERLKGAEKVAIVGNGGIALELVYSLSKAEACKQIVWVVRHGHLGNTFFDRVTSAFLLPELFSVEDEETFGEGRKPGRTELLQSERAHLNGTAKESRGTAGAVGPRWVNRLKGSKTQKPRWMDKVSFQSSNGDETKSELKNGEEEEEEGARLPNHVTLQLNTEVSKLEENSAGVRLVLTNDEEYQVDFVIAATGVLPVVPAFKGREVPKVYEDSAIVVNELLESSITGIFAAGDCCHLEVANNPHGKWHQMRLWSQARIMGHVAAHSMSSLDREDDLNLEFNFEVFAHVMFIFGKKIVLLGNHWAKDLGVEGVDYTVQARIRPGEYLIRIIQVNHRVVGAVLIGDTDLEETMENLILDEVDLRDYGDELLAFEDVDLEDMFD